jgi:hypothetical protein
VSTNVFSLVVDGHGEPGESASSGDATKSDAYAHGPPGGHNEGTYIDEGHKDGGRRALSPETKCNSCQQTGHWQLDKECPNEIQLRLPVKKHPKPGLRKRLLGNVSAFTKTKCLILTCTAFHLVETAQDVKRAFTPRRPQVMIYEFFEGDA